jgi:hypothetical protein
VSDRSWGELILQRIAGLERALADGAFEEEAHAAAEARAERDRDTARATRRRS